MFHHFHDGRKHTAGQGSISACQLREIIVSYRRTHTILSAGDWYAGAVGGTLSNGQVCLTFDDALRCQYDIALPVLDEFGIKAFWFVYTSPLDNVIEKLELYRYVRNTAFEDIEAFYRAFYKTAANSEFDSKIRIGLAFFPGDYLPECGYYSREDKVFRYIRDKILGRDQYDHIMQTMITGLEIDMEGIKDSLWMDRTCIVALKEQGHLIGLHSHTHPTVMAQLSCQQQAEEYQLNCQKIRELIHDDVVCVSHPCNSYDYNTLKILSDLGIRIGFRANMALEKHSMLEYPRIDHAFLVGAQS
jgi:peptidoglycan/xylan/chitin deacetylase (PgdA/CDA1 family)